VNLIPKIVGAADLNSLRGIACLSTARKVLGYIWMRMLPPMQSESFQTGFIPGAHAAGGVFAIKRAAELSREWNQKIFALQLDLSKAFDRVLHSAVVKALELQGCSPQCIAVICSILRQSQASFKLGHVSTNFVSMLRGLPQGAPESPRIFVLVMELVLRPLLHKWRSRGSGWCLDSLWLAAVCFADDVVIVSSSLVDLCRMAEEFALTLSEVGLEVGAKKCHWTSYPPLPSQKLPLHGASLDWEAQINFVGAVLNFAGNDGLAMELRLVQAEKAFHRW
jgi:hypothetical protein